MTFVFTLYIECFNHDLESNLNSSAPSHNNIKNLMSQTTRLTQQLCPTTLFVLMYLFVCDVYASAMVNQPFPVPRFCCLCKSLLKVISFEEDVTCLKFFQFILERIFFYFVSGLLFHALKQEYLVLHCFYFV